MDSYWIKVSAKDVEALEMAANALDTVVEQPFRNTGVESTLPAHVVRNLGFYALGVRRAARDVTFLTNALTGQKPASWLDRVGGAPALLIFALLALGSLVGGYLGGALAVLLLAIGA